MEEDKLESPLPTDTVGKSGSGEGSCPWAIEAIMFGEKVTRKEWDNRREYCLLKDNFLQIYREEKFHNWIVSEGDMLALDWMTI